MLLGSGRIFLEYSMKIWGDHPLVHLMGLANLEHDVRWVDVYVCLVQLHVLV